MNEDPQSRPPSDRDVTLTAVSLTFQRARAVQRKLTGPPAWGPDEPGQDGPDPVGGEPAGAGIDADADIEEAGGTGPGGAAELAQLAFAAECEEQSELPNSLVTNAKFHHYLDSATALSGPVEVRGLRRFKPRRATQARYNAAIVQALHQLDHRTRLQQREITRLEAELAEVHRTLAGLEDDEDPEAGGQ